MAHAAAATSVKQLSSKRRQQQHAQASTASTASFAPHSLATAGQHQQHQQRQTKRSSVATQHASDIEKLARCNGGKDSRQRAVASRCCLCYTVHVVCM